MGTDGKTLLVAALALLPLAGCIGETAAPAPAGATDDGSTVREAVVTRGSLNRRLILTGELQAIEADEIIVPRTPNWQMPIRWMEADGAAVAEGQKVLELDNSQFSADLGEKRLAEARALNQLMQKEADIAVELADGEFAVERARVAMHKARLEAEIPEALQPRRDYQEKQLAFSRSEIALAKAREDLQVSRQASDSALEELRIALERARKEVRTAEAAIAALILTAPRSGILVVEENREENRKYQVGDNVWVGLPVMQIPELSSMKVEALLSDVDDGRIAVGMKTLCSLDTYPDTVFPGRVVDITPIAQEQGRDSMRRAFHVVVHLDESDIERMRPGMSVKVEVLPEAGAEALLVPRAALDFSGETPRARLRSGSLVEVRLGDCDTNRCVVEEGLEEGDRVRARG